ncbi:MAG TPA: AmmeMemoRadiSam system protein B, partial [Terriglobia bacterium]|nr:AmmeMemoRadiSam system protein B [Terriglobia bacterium]
MQAPVVRRPAVAGRFYPSNPQVLVRDLETYLGEAAAGADPKGQTLSGALACIVPHAGYMYSGHVAGAVYRVLPRCSAYIILAPNHFGRGSPLAIMSSGGWLTPLGEAPIDAALARSVAHACHLLAEDASAHAGEHSLEVQLPFLQHLVKPFSFVPISIAAG